MGWFAPQRKQRPPEASVNTRYDEEHLLAQALESPRILKLVHPTESLSRTSLDESASSWPILKSRKFDT
jgi:hypothetical protein